MKLSITVGGVVVPNYTDASIVYDAKYSSTATFTTRQATNGAGWYSNLSKILIAGRDLQPESGAWGFEEPTDFYGWSLRQGVTVTGLTPAAQDSATSIYGQASLKLDAAASLTYDLFRSPDNLNMNGLTFWAWFTAAGGAVYVTPYATHGKSIWEGPRVAVTNSPQWVAAGMRVQATAIEPDVPFAVNEWGFHIENTGTATAVHMDSVDLCGHAYPQGVQLPPFAACQPTTVYGSLSCYAGHPCSNWNAFTWADGAHMTAGDAGWCPKGGVWGAFLWADERVSSADDYQWI